MKVEDQLKQMERDLRGLATGLLADEDSISETTMVLGAVESIQKLRYHFVGNWIGEHEQFQPAAEPAA
jgi:hypothetical protein